MKQYIAHHRGIGVICWRQAEPEEVEELLGDLGPGRTRRFHPVELLHCIGANPERNQAFYKAEAARRLQCSANTVQNALTTAADKGWIRFEEQGQHKIYHLTAKGEERVKTTPSTVDWTDH